MSINLGILKELGELEIELLSYAIDYYVENIHDVFSVGSDDSRKYDDNLIRSVKEKVLTREDSFTDEELSMFSHILDIFVRELITVNVELPNGNDEGSIDYAYSFINNIIELIDSLLDT